MKYLNYRTATPYKGLFANITGSKNGKKHLIFTHSEKSPRSLLQSHGNDSIHRYTKQRAIQPQAP